MTRLITALLFSAALAIPASAQTRPDFSGTWTMDEKRSGSPAVGATDIPIVHVMQQSPDNLTVEMRRGDKAVHFAYPLMVDSKARPVKTAVSSSNRAYWDGDRLVTETVQNISGQTVTTRETRSLTSDGREMVVERVVEVEHGYTMKDAQNYSVVKDVFVRAK
jgi:hypothetical protein